MRPIIAIIYWSVIAADCLLILAVLFFVPFPLAIEPGVIIGGMFGIVFLVFAAD